MGDMSRFDPPVQSYKQITARGAFYTGLAQAARIVIQIASVVILARLLSPADFGFIAMTVPFVALIALFQNMGFTHVIIQRENLAEEDVNALFWLNLLICSVFACVFLLASPLIAGFYGAPEMGPLSAAFAAIVLIQGISAVPEALLQRQMRFGLVAFISVMMAFLILAVTIAATFIMDNYWAIYWGALAGALWMSTAFWIGARWHPSWPRRHAALWDLTRFGAGMTSFNFTNFLSRNLDNLLIGQRWGSTDLGLYDRAYKLLLFPLQQIANPLGKVVIPALSRLQDEPARYQNAFLKAHAQLLIVLLPGVIFLLVTADLFIPFILGEKWTGAVLVFQMLGIAGLMQPVNNPLGWLFASQGRGGDFARVGVVFALFTIAAILFGLPYGIVGVAAAYAISEYIKTPYFWWAATRVGPVPLKAFLGSVLPLLGLGVLTLFAVNTVKPVFENTLFVLFVCGVVSYGVFLTGLLCFARGRALLTESVDTARLFFMKSSV